MKDRLKEYIEKDEIYQDYKNGKSANASDFDKFCVRHCKDIEELLEENEELKREHEKWNRQIKSAEEMLDIQRQDGNYNYDEYMLGMYNGMEYIASLFRINEPKFISAKDIKFLHNRTSERDSAEKELEEIKRPNYYVKGLEGTLKEYQQTMTNYENQQQEFIKYLEDEIKELEEVKKYPIEFHESNLLVKRFSVILQKYLEIIGDKDE